MNSKVWHKSKTMRVAGLYAALGLAILTLPQFEALVGAAVPVPYLGIAMLVISGVKAALRTMTDSPIAIRPVKTQVE